MIVKSLCSTEQKTLQHMWHSCVLFCWQRSV